MFKIIILWVSLNLLWDKKLFFKANSKTRKLEFRLYIGGDTHNEYSSC